MKLSSPTPSDRLGPPGRRSKGGGGGAWAPALVYGLVLPFSILALAASGWYVATGETPFDLFDELVSAPRIEAPMPPRIGPERPSASLIRPPAVNDPDVKMAMAPVPEPKKPEAPAAADTPPPPTAEAPKPAEAPAAAPEPPAAEHPEALNLPPSSTGAAPPNGAAVTAPPPPPAMSEPLIPPGGEPLAPPSFTQLPSRSDLKALMPMTPLPELMKVTPAGVLPITAGGKEARIVYARPSSAEHSQPRIAIVVAGLGLSKEASEAAISKLPPEVSLSFSPYAGNLDNWVKKARNSGHEVLIDLPLEPPNYPLHDAGPLAVLAHQTPIEAMAHLEGVLSKTNSYVGLAGALRSPVAASEHWVPMLRSLKGRGLLFVGDGLVGVGEDDVPASATVTLVADETPFRAAIDARLARLMAAAQRDGSAVTYASPRPVTFERLLAWIDSFPQKGVALVPVSAVVRPQAP